MAPPQADRRTDSLKRSARRIALNVAKLPDLLRKARSADLGTSKPSRGTSLRSICLLRRGYRVDGAFLSKCGGSDPSPRALRPPDNPAWGARTAAALQTRWRYCRFALGTAVLLWATNTLLNTCQGRRFAQPALKLWSWREQRRDLAICQTFLPLNAELVACRTSKMESLRSVPLRFPGF